MMKYFFLLLSAHTLLESSTAFSVLPGLSLTRTSQSQSLPLKSSPTPNPEPLSAEEELEIQWNLFRQHHAKASGEWKGIWTTYDYIGDVIDETVASVNYKSPSEDSEIVQQTHSVVQGAKRSDCATCFDSMDVKEFPVKSYNKNDPTNTVFQKTRLAANAMVNGPTLLRSGFMATELILSWGDGRVRVTFQHAPVWQAGVEPGSGPPQGLKLFRTMISREALRKTAPTAEMERADPPTEGNPTFYRPVPPFNWHKKWAGTSWTWGPNSGDRGWVIETLEEEDAWQGIPTVERWNLRLPGGIFVQAPRVITDMGAELCRLAWLPDDETLLRVEAGCLALQPMDMEDDELVGFYPPSLASLRTDVLKKQGELDDLPSFVQQQKYTDEFAKPQAEQEERAPSPPSPMADAAARAAMEAAAKEEWPAPPLSSTSKKVQQAEPKPTAVKKEDSTPTEENDNDDGPAARDALSL